MAEVNSSVPTPEPTKEKKKRTYNKKKTVKPTNTFSSEQISTLLMAITGILASREGMEIFALNETEAQQIAEPLSSIIVDVGYSETVGKYGNYIALATAVLMVFTPRIVLYMQIQKTKKINKNGGLKLEPVEKTESKNSSRGNDNGTSNRSTNALSNDNKGILATIPALA